MRAAACAVVRAVATLLSRHSPTAGLTAHPDRSRRGLLGGIHRTAAALVACAAVVSGFAGCGGALQPYAHADATGFEIGVHGDWRQLATGIASIFSHEQKQLGLPDFTLAHADAPVTTDAKAFLQPRNR
jgi:hypothetical protein